MRAVHGWASVAAQMQPFKAECSAFRQSEMRLGADAGLLHQMRAAENAGCSWLSERCCANGALQGGVQRVQ